MNCFDNSGMDLEPGRKSKKKASSAVIWYSTSDNRRLIALGCHSDTLCFIT